MDPRTVVVREKMDQATGPPQRNKVGEGLSDYCPELWFLSWSEFTRFNIGIDPVTTVGGTTVKDLVGAGIGVDGGPTGVAGASLTSIGGRGSIED